jgi:hypothetical protein
MSIPTAEEFLKEYNNHDHSKSEGCSCRHRDIVALREFAKLHVEAALKAASRKAYFRDSNGFVCTTEENKKSILNAYPLSNIK